MRLRRLPRLFVRLGLPAAAGALALGVAAGCSGPAKISPNPPPDCLPAGVIDAAAPPGTYLPMEQATTDALRAAAELQPAAANRPVNVLALSGGGQFAAYAAGMLVGWSCRGDRPDFDVVTGISSGALIAALVYAGPKYDPALAHLVTTVTADKLFRVRPVLVHILRDRAFSSPDPFKRLLDATFNDEVVADMAAAHRCGRRLFIGTMNALTRRLTVWDVGAIAASGRPDAGGQVRDILLASSSIAGHSPPVELDIEVNGVCFRECHVDAGGVAEAFVRFGPECPRPDPANPAARWLAGSNLYVIDCGKLYKDTLAERPGLFGGILSTVTAGTSALFRTDACRLFALCSVSGMSFHMAAIPPDVSTGDRSMTFQPEIERRVYRIGYDFITHGDPWRCTPPGYEPGEDAPPRAGFRFTVPGAGPACRSGIGGVTVDG